MPRFAAALLALLGIGAAGCSDIPPQGFVTTALGGTYAGVVREGLSAPDQPHAYPDDPPGRDARTGRDDCLAAARARADDVGYQGFGVDTQKTVYDATLKDCRGWATRQ